MIRNRTIKQYKYPAENVCINPGNTVLEKFKCIHSFRSQNYSYCKITKGFYCTIFMIENSLFFYIFAPATTVTS